MTSLLKAFDDVQIEVHNTFLRFRKVNEKSSDNLLKPSEPCVITQVVTQEKSAIQSSKGEESSELFTIDEEKNLNTPNINNIKLLSADAPEFHFQDGGMIYTQTWEDDSGYFNDSFQYADTYYPEWLGYDHAALGGNSPTPSTCEDEFYNSKVYSSDSRNQWWSEAPGPEQLPPAPPTNTTVMIRNIPSKLMQNDMIKIIDDMGFFQRLLSSVTFYF
jgi:hypothetical protein